MKKRLLWIGLLAVVLVCAIVNVVIVNTTVRPPKKYVIIMYKPECNLPVDSRLVTANNNFGIELFKKLYSNAPDLNIIISPSSFSLALSMIYNGADGKTREGMAKTLGYQGMTLGQVNNANSALLANMEGQGEGVFIRVANSLWAKNDVNFKSDFLDQNKKFYNAQITKLDFNDSSLASSINSWVSEKTEGNIDRIVEQIDPNIMLYLVNAIYFKANWTDRFESNNTKSGSFTLISGEKKTLWMMERHGYMRCYRGDKFQALSLPYGEGRSSMYLFLPNVESNIKEFVGNLDSNNWNMWMSGFYDESFSLSLPRFNIKYEARDALKNILSAMGMQTAFDPQYANFQKMSSGQAWISQAAHKTFITVTEEGTEAAADSGLGPSPGIPSLVFDRPFFLAIRDNKTGIILFMGAVLDPQSD